jgi:hypothetical protein
VNLWIIITPTSKTNQRGDRRARQNKNSGGVVAITQSHFPSTFQSNVRFKHMFRFQTSASLGTPGTVITRAQLLGLLFVNRTGGTTNAGIIAGIKINRLRMYGVGGSTSTLPFTPSSVSVEWLSEYGPSSEFSDTGNAFSPASLTSVPPPQSLCSFWNLIQGANQGQTMMVLSAPAGTVIDLWFEIVLRDGEAENDITTVAAGVVGQLYAGYLDAGAAAVCVPVSYLSLN